MQHKVFLLTQFSCFLSRTILIYLSKIAVKWCPRIEFRPFNMPISFESSMYLLSWSKCRFKNLKWQIKFFSREINILASVKTSFGAGGTEVFIVRNTIFCCKAFSLVRYIYIYSLWCKRNTLRADIMYSWGLILI